MRSRRTVLALALVLALVAAGCGDDDSANDASEATPTAAEEPTEAPTPEPEPTATPEPTPTPEPEPLRLLVVNDDGVGAEGIDVLVGALNELPDVEVMVVPPAENQSGTSDSVSDVPPPATDASTASGHPAVAVDGFPADAVNHALDTLGLEPHLVVSGINEGPNLGIFVDLSGTVGAARTAARAGIPALALSACSSDPDYDLGAAYAVEWITEHRDALLDGTAAVAVISANFPTCAAGNEVLGELEVPVATEFLDGQLEGDCDLGVDPANDAEAYLTGYVTISDVTG